MNADTDGFYSVVLGISFGVIIVFILLVACSVVMGVPIVTLTTPT